MEEIYTDGSCLGNPGVGGWAFLHAREDGISSQFGNMYNTTNNVMELTAVIEALKYVQTEHIKLVVIITDSNYVKQGITVWSIKWVKNNWIGSTGTTIKNVELWQELVQMKNTLEEQGIEIQWKWVKAHNVNKYNNMVDKLARESAMKLK